MAYPEPSGRALSRSTCQPANGRAAITERLARAALKVTLRTAAWIVGSSTSLSPSLILIRRTPPAAPAPSASPPRRRPAALSCSPLGGPSGCPTCPAGSGSPAAACRSRPRSVDDKMVGMRHQHRRRQTAPAHQGDLLLAMLLGEDQHLEELFALAAPFAFDPAHEVEEHVLRPLVPLRRAEGDVAHRRLDRGQLAGAVLERALRARFTPQERVGLLGVVRPGMEEPPRPAVGHRVAERRGFEPWVGLPPQRLSKKVTRDESLRLRAPECGSSLRFSVIRRATEGPSSGSAYWPTLASRGLPNPRSSNAQAAAIRAVSLCPFSAMLASTRTLSCSAVCEFRKPCLCIDCRPVHRAEWPSSTYPPAAMSTSHFDFPLIFWLTVGARSARNLRVRPGRAR